MQSNKSCSPNCAARCVTFGKALAFLLLLLNVSGCGTVAEVGGDIEGFTKLRSFWKQRITHCGDAILIFYDGTYYELAHGELVMKAVPLSEADRRNGVEWSGGSVLKGTATRASLNGQWQPWIDGVAYSLNFLIIQMNKVEGQWQMESLPFNDKITAMTAPRCEDAPPDR